MNDSQAPLQIRDLSAYYGTRQAVAGVTMSFAANAVTALMGPSGCGKTTILRCLNRIHEIAPGAYARGQVLLDGEDVYDSELSVIELRRRVGMVFQRANPFPTLSILGNVTSGLTRSLSAAEKMRRAEKALRSAALWDEVKDKLQKPATALSGGQQQRLCIARALAVEPEVLLMDEPTSSLDPISTLSIEELMTALAAEYTIVVVTHNMQQAARVSNRSAFMLADEHGVGRLVEIDETSKIFTKPKDKRTEDYITGRFG
ncbi:MAG: phosphate ABC transporter ATP-binding protein [Candidatus Eremiobacteraeota bacterium]|nr:phosphate ABC transporter ATP-binding protein [Candidatus Eremiobacteraeota bacterium]